MKGSWFSLCILFLLFFFSLDIQAQRLDPIDYIVDEATEEAEIAIAIRVNDDKITKVRVISTTGKDAPIKKIPDDSRSFSVKVKLVMGENKFNIIGFDENDSIRYGTSVIKVKRTPKEEDTGDADDEVDKNDDVAEADTKDAKEKEKEKEKDKDKDKKAKISFGKNAFTETNEPRIKVPLVLENLPKEAKKFRIENKQNKEGNKNAVEIAKTEDTANSPQSIPLELKSDKNEITVTVLNADDKPIGSDGKPIADDDDKKEEKKIKATASINCHSPCEFVARSINTRAIVGLEQVGASSANSETRPFIDLFFNFPIGGKREKDPRFSVWTDFRFTSAATQNFADLSSIASNIITPVLGQNNRINNVVQAFQITAGIDLRVIPEGMIHPSFIPGKNSISFIAGGGVTNPLKSEDAAQVFKIPTVGMTTTLDPNFTALFPDVDFTGKTNIAFVPPERDRFFRRWFAGMRLKSRFYENENTFLDQSPAMLDITFGQDESITKKLTKKILTVEGFSPFPIKKFDYIYLYGGVTMRLTRKVNETIVPFFLRQVFDANLFDNTTVAVPIDSSPFTSSNRDIFRFGIGIDLIRLINRARTPATETEK